MDPTADFITQAEQRVQTELLAENWFQGVTVLTNENGDLLAKITSALAGVKLFAIIRVYEGKIPMQGDSEPWDCEIVVTENAALNRGKKSNGKTARHMVQKIIAAPKTAVNLETAREMPSGDFVVWQLKGTVEVTISETI
jgi:hypothetical protein